MVLGEGRPKICVPLVSPSFDELDRECAALESQHPDMLEWRVDYLLNKEDFNATADLDKAFRIIRSHFQDTPLLTTLRTKSQGGVHKTPGGDYIRLISLILASRWADIIDIEYGHEMLDTKILMAGQSPEDSHAHELSQIQTGPFGNGNRGHPGKYALLPSGHPENRRHA